MRNWLMLKAHLETMKDMELGMRINIVNVPLGRPERFDGLQPLFGVGPRCNCKMGMAFQSRNLWFYATCCAFNVIFP